MRLDHLATLLEYPVAPPARTCAEAIDDDATDARVTEQLHLFATAMAPLTLSAAQELYVRTFDFDASTALYAGHHLFGEEGRRGLLIAGLVERYERLRMPVGTELADHLAPMLRSLAVDGESDEAREIVWMALRPALSKVRPEVERRAPAYGALVRAVSLVVEAWPGEPFDYGSDRCRSSSSPYFLTLLS